MTAHIDPDYECLYCGAPTMVELQPIESESTDPIYVTVRWCSKDANHRDVKRTQPNT